MKNFAVNISIILLILLAYRFDIFDIFVAKHTGWIIGVVIFLLFIVAIKILGNPFAKDEDHD